VAPYTVTRTVDEVIDEQTGIANGRLRTRSAPLCVLSIAALAHVVSGSSPGPRILPLTSPCRTWTRVVRGALGRRHLDRDKFGWTFTLVEADAGTVTVLRRRSGCSVLESVTADRQG
jgi:hypothetical protein